MKDSTTLRWSKFPLQDIELAPCSATVGSVG